LYAIIDKNIIEEKSVVLISRLYIDGLIYRDNYSSTQTTIHGKFANLIIKSQFIYKFSVSCLARSG